jgi:soluble lytic murein transglycosylase
LLLPVLAAVLALAPTTEAPGARARAEAPAANGAATQGDAKDFRPESIRLGDAAPEQAMLRALAVADRAQARKLGEAALDAADAATRGRLLWLIARTETDPKAVQVRLSALSQSQHPLARWAGLRLAASVRARESSRAVNILRGLDEGWAGANEATLQLALALHSAGDAAAAEPRLRALLARVGPDAIAPMLALALAEILAKRRDPDALREALSLCRGVSSRTLTGSAPKRADALCEKILARLPPKTRAALQRPGADDELARGKALMNAHRYDEALHVLDRLTVRVKRDSARHCKVELEAGHTLLFQKKAEQAAKRLRAAAEHCDEPDTRAWSRYYAGTAYQRSGDPRSAVGQYEALVRELPQHSLADDALLLEGVALADAGDAEGKRKALQRLLSLYPKGDMRGEARYALAFDARARGDHAEALEQLERLIDEGSPEQAEGYEGRAPYWRARSLQALGKLDLAKAAFLDVVRAVPFSYHAQQALARLDELDPLLASSALAGLADPGPVVTSLVFGWRSELDGSAFRSAVELLRVGEVDLAQREFTWLKANADDADADLSWIVAATLYEAGALPEASQMARSRLRSFHKSAPVGRDRLLWRIAYPRAYEPLIESAALEAGVPAEFVRGVAREESSFNPNSVSSALAYGLIQVIRPTARTYARSLKLPSDPMSLKRPEINLRIGAHYIQSLWLRYPQNPAVVPAAYNAGEAAADKWLRERGSQPLDEWIEAIPYRETRRYTRRVLQSYGIYAWLDTGKLPKLPSVLPPAPAL